MKNQFYLFLLIAVAVMNSCRKENADDNSTPGNLTSTQINATISGRVIDGSGASLQGVNVSANGTSTTTDANGIFLFEGSVDKKRCVLEFNKPGYLKRLHGILPSDNSVNYINIVLQIEPASQSLQSSSGGSVSIDHGGSVIFPANAFVIDGSANPYNGIVTVISNHISPDNPDFSMLIPGGDMAGTNIDEEDVSLYSFGMATVILKGSAGENLQLASGTQATITFPIAASQSASAPQTIPLWYLDETEALWKEEGQATRIGNNYVGSVSHFSIWNCDYGGPRADIIGRVVDCEGTPLANVVVTVNGGLTVTTDGNGYYSIWVPSGWTLDFQVLPQGTILLSSQKENVAPLQTGQTYTVPDLVVPCGSRLRGHLTGCENETISGGIYITLNGSFVSHLHTTDGSFDLLCAPNTTYELYVYSSSGSFHQTVITPTLNTNLDIGTIELCSNFITSNSFIINGNIFNNQFIDLSNPVISTGQYSNSEVSTTIQVNGATTSLGLTAMIIKFNGNQPVSVDLSQNPGDGYFHVSGNAINIIPAVGGTNHFFLNVTEYGSVGDTIKGTFYGDVKYGLLSDSGIGFISEGKFAVIRLADF